MRAAGCCLTILLALVIGFAPVCQAQSCGHSCCAGHSGSCTPGVDLQSNLSCARSVNAPLPDGLNDANRAQAGVQASEFSGGFSGVDAAHLHGALDAPPGARSNAASPPPLRI
jgi:hypothetical protein